MRCILIDSARRKSRSKRGCQQERVDLEGLELAGGPPLVVYEAPRGFAAQMGNCLEDVEELNPTRFPQNILASRAGKA